MTQKAGTVFSLVKDAAPIEGCTTSRALFGGAENAVIVFSMAAHTDISAETYRTCKLLWVLEGAIEITCKETGGFRLAAGQAAWTPAGGPVGVQTEQGAVYLEIAPERTEKMSAIQPGIVFQLADLVPYQSGSIVNRDILQTPGMKLVVMSFDAGTGLSEHAAPGNALLFGLEGEAVVRYEGEDHVLGAGEEILFAKNGRHAVRAKTPFKMALLISLE